LIKNIGIGGMQAEKLLGDPDFKREAKGEKNYESYIICYFKPFSENLQVKRWLWPSYLYLFPELE